MKSFFKKHRNKLLFLFIFLLIPIITLSYTESDKYTLRKNNNSVTVVFKPISSNNTTYEAAGVCFYNNSDLDYFIPNKTRGEWTNFYNLVIDGNPSTVYGVAQKTDCCIDGVCGGSETTESCPIDCGNTGTICPTSIDFIDPYTGLMTNYPTVQIGNKCWFQKNLGYGDRGGKQILSSTNPSNNSEEEKYCYSNSYTNCSSYGGLYTWNEAMQYSATEKARGVCPEGWHIPSAAEFTTLSNYLGGDNVAGATLKGQGAEQFKAVLSGFLASGSFSSLNTSAFFWTSTQASSTAANSRSLNNVNSSFFAGADNKTNALAVRCVRDDLAASYSLVYSSGLNGYLTGNLNQTVSPGDSGTAVTAVPNYGYSFYNWSDGSTANPRTDTNVNANKNISASYVPDPCYWGLCNAACTQNCPTYTTGGIGGVYNHDLCDYGLCDASCCYNCQGGYCQ